MSHNNAGNAAQFPFPNIEAFKLKSHADNELILAFLRERQALETTYANDLIKLVEKFRPQCNHRPNVDKLLDFTAALTKDHAQVAKFLSSTANMFERHITAERRSIIGLQSNLVNSVGPDRIEMLSRAERSKENYLKKMADNAVLSLRSYETTQELQELTQAYRDDIVELEKNRSIILDGREFAKRTFDKYESESLNKIQGFYKAFAKSIDTLAKNKLKAADTFAQITMGLKGYRFDEVHFENFWPIPPNVYFEHYESGSPLKDLIFGVPLSFTFRNLPAVLPPFLKNSIEQIDKRGLHVEGLYRVSAKNSDRDKARIELETDLNAFNWEIADIHLLTGLVKAYLRELPEPLFPFPRADRDAYSATNNEATRLVKLTTMVRGLQRNNMTALKFLLEHLNRVNAHHDKNKMGIENVSLIFSALLFERQNVARTMATDKDNKEKDKSSSSHSWFKLGSKSSKQEKEEKKSGVHAPADRASYLATGSSNNLGAASTEMVADSFKNDMVLSDLMRHIEALFPSLEDRKSALLSTQSLLGDLASSPGTESPTSATTANPPGHHTVPKVGSTSSIPIAASAFDNGGSGSKSSIKTEEVRDPSGLLSDEIDQVVSELTRSDSLKKAHPAPPHNIDATTTTTTTTTTVHQNMPLVSTFSPSSKESFANASSSSTTVAQSPSGSRGMPFDKIKQDKISSLNMGLRTDIKKDRSVAGGGAGAATSPKKSGAGGGGGGDHVHTHGGPQSPSFESTTGTSIGASTITSASIASALKTTLSNSSLNNVELSDILPPTSKS